MLIHEAARAGKVEDGWYEYTSNEKFAIRVEDGMVVRGVAPDGLGMKPTWPYMRSRQVDAWVKVENCTVEQFLHDGIEMK